MNIKIKNCRLCGKKLEIKRISKGNNGVEFVSDEAVKKLDAWFCKYCLEELKQ
jgi:hypothetical protein